MSINGKVALITGAGQGIGQAIALRLAREDAHIAIVDMKEKKMKAVGTGYAIWTGIGAVGTTTLGILLFAEPLTTSRVLGLLLIVGGVVGLKFTAS